MNALSSGWGILFLLGRQPRFSSPLVPELDNGSWLTTSTYGGAMDLRLCFGAIVIVRQHGITLCDIMLISKAGAGKTIIRRVCRQLLASNTDFYSSIVIENLLSIVQDLTESTVLYHFCDLAVRKSIVVLQSFLRQILHEGNRHQVSLLERCCKHSNNPSLKELSTTLSDTARLNKNTFIVVDAFEDRKSLIPILRGFTKAGIKVLVTSRDIPDIRDALQTEKCLQIEAERSDLELYVGSRLTESDHYESLNPNAGIISAIIDQADGM